MADYTPNQITWADDDGSGTTGTLMQAAHMNNMEAGIADATTHHRSGTYAARPAAATGNKGWLYFATDVGVSFLSDGTQWLPVGDKYSILPANLARPGVLDISEFGANIITSSADRRLSVDIGRGLFQLPDADYANLPGAGSNVWGNDLILPENTSAPLQIVFPAPSTGHDRMDTVIAVLDPTTMTISAVRVGGTEVVTGGVTLDSRSGAPSAAALNTAAGGAGSGRYFLLYDVIARAASATLSSTDYRDRRPRANGSFMRPRFTALPLNPADGDEIDFVADSANGVIWVLKYNAGSASAYKWEFQGGSDLAAYNSASVAPANTAYASTNATTITLPLAGDYDCYAEGEGKAPSAQAMYLGPSISVGGIADTTARKTDNSVSTAVIAMAQRITGVTAASVLGVYAKVTGGTGALAKTALRARPVRVG